MISSYWMFVSLSAAGFSLFSLALLFLWYRACFHFGGFKRLPDGGWQKWPYVVLFLLLPLGAPVVSLLLAQFWVVPPSAYQEEYDGSEESDMELVEFESKAARLRQKLDNAGALTAKELESFRPEFLILRADMNEIVSRSHKIIAELRKRIERERRSAEKLRELAETLSGTTKRQLDAVKMAVTENAREAGRYQLLLGAAISFPMGVLSSLFASWLFKGIVFASRRDVEDADFG